MKQVLKYTANRNVLESALSPDLALLALGMFNTRTSILH